MGCCHGIAMGVAVGAATSSDICLLDPDTYTSQRRIRAARWYHQGGEWVLNIHGGPVTLGHVPYSVNLTLLRSESPKIPISDVLGKRKPCGLGKPTCLLGQPRTSCITGITAQKNPKRFEVHSTSFYGRKDNRLIADPRAADRKQFTEP